MDVLEFKIGLIILLVIGILALVLFNFSSVKSWFGIPENEISLENSLLYLEEQSLYHDLLTDYLKQDSLGDFISLGDKQKIDSEFKGKKLFPLAVVYPRSETEAIEIRHTLFTGGLGAPNRELTSTVIPTYDGEGIIEVRMLEESYEQER